jgi:predicted Zn-dependent peptidase
MRRSPGGNRKFIEYPSIRGGDMKKRYLIVLFALFSALFMRMHACAEDIRLDVREFTLKNGMKVLIVPRHVKPTFQAYMMFDAGAIREAPGATGIAHLLEHMMFKGTKDFGTWNYKEEEPLMKEIDALADEWYGEKARTRNAYGGGSPEKMKALEERMKSLLETQRKYIISNELQGIYSKNGSSNFNAFTGGEMVCYIISLPANRLELWAAIESDRMANSVFREFYSERDVVNEERRMGEVQPSGRLWREFYNMMYASSPYRNPVVGYESDIMTVRRKDAQDFYRRLYAPNNAVLVLVGDLEPSRAMETIRNYFGPIPAVPRPEMKITLEREQHGERRIDLEADASPELIIGFHGPPSGSSDHNVMKIIARILSSGRSSRLHKNLVNDRKIARLVSASYNANRFVTSFELSATPLSPHSAAELEEAIYNELETLKSKPVDARELEKTINMMEMDFVGSLKYDGSVAYLLSSNSLKTGDWRNYDDRSKLRSVRPEDIMEVAGKYFVKKNRTVATLTKVSQAEKARGEKPESKAAADSTKALSGASSQKSESHSSPGALRVAKLPLSALKMKVPEIGAEIKRVKLSNGLIVFLWEDRTLPMVSMYLILKDGALYESSGNQGISKITAYMIRNGGTQKRSAAKLDEDIDHMGAAFSVSSGSPETSFFSFSSLSRNFEEGLRVFTEALSEPAFQADRLDLRKGQIREDEKRKNDNPQSPAYREFYRALFGSHPYGWINDTNYSSIKKLTRDDIEKWYRARYTPGNAFLFVIGDFDPTKMTESLEATLGAWKSHDASALSTPAPEVDTKGGTYFIQKDISQSVILMGHESVNRYSSDRYALEVMNYILGGGSFGSRLMKKIRSDEGLAYHVDSKIDMDYKDSGVFVAFVQTKSESTGKVIAMMKREFETMKTTSVTDEELKWAKDSLVNRFVHLLDDTIGYRTMILEIQGMPADFYKTYASRISAVTLDDVKRVAVKYLHPDRLDTVIVGDRKKMGSQLDGIGEIREIKLEELRD